MLQYTNLNVLKFNFKLSVNDGKLQQLWVKLD